MKKQTFLAAALLLFTAFVKGYCRQDSLASPPSQALSVLTPQEKAPAHPPIPSFPFSPYFTSPDPVPLSAGEKDQHILEQATFTETADDGIFTYNLYDFYAVITGFSANYAHNNSERFVSLHIPAEYGTLPIRIIGADAFSASCGILLHQVTFPDGLWRIEERAFLDQHYLDRVSLPDSLLYIGEMAFICQDPEESHSPLLLLNHTVFTGSGQEIVNKKRFDVTQ